MTLSTPFPYRFNRFEPGIFVEIYLPKKIRYQGVLYECLRTGFNFNAVKTHLTTSSHFIQIKEFLEDYEELHSIYRKSIEDNNFTPILERVNRMTHVFRGYSMYEVDGVFFDKDGFDGCDEADTISKFIAEETVQVIRLMFLPDMKYIFDQVGIIRDPTSKIRMEEFHIMRDFFVQSLERQYVLKYKLKRQKASVANNDGKADILKRQKRIHDMISD